jgi:hypothetical protein
MELRNLLESLANNTGCEIEWSDTEADRIIITAYFITEEKGEEKRTGYSITIDTEDLDAARAQIYELEGWLLTKRTEMIDIKGIDEVA